MDRGAWRATVHGVLKSWTFMSCPIHWESNVEQNAKSILSNSLKVNSDMCSVELTTVPSNSPKISKWDMFV